jgi:hypothetical protein
MADKQLSMRDSYFGPRNGDMQFRLTYEGLLLAQKKNDGRADHKHEIRKIFHKQFKRLWSRGFLGGWVYYAPTSEGLLHPNTPRPFMWQSLAKKYTRNGYMFVPLCTADLTLSCRIEILFLRPDEPGSLIKSGDIDNRLKTLFDALRMPENSDELGKYKTPAADEQPFFVLLQDDKLISHVSIETDMLLEPVSEPPDANDTRLILTITIRPANVTMGNLNFV